MPKRPLSATAFIFKYFANTFAMPVATACMPPPGEPPAMEIVLGQFCGAWAETSVTPKISEKNITKETTLKFNILIIANPPCCESVLQQLPYLCRVFARNNFPARAGPQAFDKQAWPGLERAVAIVF